ncbi:MAG: hypothetical protein EOP88_07695 [Verrucomicrobiaceae bacterium]|nr:MAG: hypothetical protein EOP88_07695 [Verrucomicrobiaceae bacterium]
MNPPLNASNRRWIIGLLVVSLFGTLAYMAMVREEEPSIDLSKEQAPFPAMKLPLRTVDYGGFAVAVSGPPGGSYGGTFIDVTDAGGTVQRFEWNDFGPGSAPPCQEVRWNDAPMADPPRAKEILLHLLKEHNDPVPDVYYTLSGKKPPSGPLEKIRSLFK